MRHFTSGRLCAACLAVAFLVLPAALCAAAEAGKVLQEHWHAVYMGGRKVGYTHTHTVEKRKDGAPLFETTVRQHLTVDRGGMQMTTETISLVAEDATGRVVSFRNDCSLMGLISGRLVGDRFVITSSGPHMQTVQRVRRLDGLAPWAADRLGRQHGLDEGTSYSIRVFWPEWPQTPVELSFTVGPVEPVEVFDVTRWLHRIDSTNSLLPGLTSTIWVDAEGTPWLGRDVLGGGMVLEFSKTTRELALAEGEPADLLAASIVRPDQPIPAPERLERLQLLLPPAEPGAPTPLLPTDAHQQVEAVPQGLLVTLRRACPPTSGYTLPYRGEEHAGLLRASTWLEVDDPLIQQMAREAIGNATDSVTAARRIETFVDRTIQTKTLGVGMATAAETARQKAGDCTEHAFLAAALARAAGMPSRIVAGLAHMEEGGFFLHHMWTEIWVGEWMPIDSALGGHSATHIALARSALNEPDDALQLAASAVPFMGGLKVHVISSRMSEEEPVTGPGPVRSR